MSAKRPRKPAQPWQETAITAITLEAEGEIIGRAYDYPDRRAKLGFLEGPVSLASVSKFTPAHS